MFRNILLVLISLLLTSNAFPQKKSLIVVKCPLVKFIEFKDTASETDKDIYRKCNEWSLAPKDTYKIFSLVKPITSEQKNNLYNWLPCYFKTTVDYKGNIYTMEVNAASFIVLYNDKTTLYFGCSSEGCKKYFILNGGNASAD